MKIARNFMKIGGPFTLSMARVTHEKLSRTASHP
jgi:hypothetical protein